MNKFILIFAAVMLAGCSTTSAKTHVKRGVSGIEVDCSGLGGNWSKCEKRAARECKMQGYKVITRSSDAKDEEGDYPFGWNPAGAVTRTMLVICN
ncbi:MULTISPECIES: hypothetical protein [unclassified Pseudomonas]|jgi:hypothetical protein|uniref:hypothetical protein n=1 Tax=unclassified Pseudomonas TaxID=196821 RepID=UPI001F59BAC3|nr:MULTISPECIES: hypothetical protein [unclassified Pseudomonas]